MAMKLLNYIMSVLMTTVIAVSIYGIIFISTQSDWTKFDEEINEHKRIISMIDMGSIKYVGDGYISFTILMNDYVKNQSSVGTIFLSCKNRLYSVMNYWNFDRLDGRGSIVSSGDSHDISAIKNGSALDKRSRMICSVTT